MNSIVGIASRPLPTPNKLFATILFPRSKLRSDRAVGGIIEQLGRLRCTGQSQSHNPCQAFTWLQLVNSYTRPFSLDRQSFLVPRRVEFLKLGPVRTKTPPLSGHDPGHALLISPGLGLAQLQLCPLFKGRWNVNCKTTPWCATHAPK